MFSVPQVKTLETLDGLDFPKIAIRSRRNDFQTIVYTNMGGISVVTAMLRPVIV